MIILVKSYIGEKCNLICLSNINKHLNDCKAKLTPSLPDTAFILIEVYYVSFIVMIKVFNRQYLFKKTNCIRRVILHLNGFINTLTATRTSISYKFGVHDIIWINAYFIQNMSKKFRKEFLHSHVYNRRKHFN